MDYREPDPDWRGEPTPGPKPPQTARGWAWLLLAATLLVLLVASCTVLFYTGADGNPATSTDQWLVAFTLVIVALVIVTLTYPTSEPRD
jgi:hypothetical protein